MASDSSAVSASLDRTQLPLYLSAAALLRSRIERGEWLVGDRLPSIEELARQIPMARLTLRQALACLEKEGLVDCRHGRGTFVARDISAQRRFCVAIDWSSLIIGITEGTQVTLAVANPPELPRLDPSEGALAPTYRYVKSVNFRDGFPYAFVSSHIAGHVFDLDPQALSSGPVLPRLAEMTAVLQIKSARQTMVISTSDVEACELLQVPLAVPIVIARRIVLDAAGIAVLVNEITYRGDYVRFEVDLLPGSPFEAARRPPKPRAGVLKGRRVARGKEAIA